MKKDINVFHVLSNKHWGGPEQYVSDLASQLKANKYYTEIISAKNDRIISRLRRLEIPISILPLGGLSDFDTPGRLAKMIRKGRNVVHAHSLKDAVSAVFARRISQNKNTRIVFTSHTIDRPKTSFIYRKVYKEVDKIIFVSQAAYDEFIDHASRFDARKAVVIHDSLLSAKTDAENPYSNLRKQLNINDNKALICCHGRLSAEKGIEVLLRALSKLNTTTFHLVIVGEGAKKYEKKLRTMARELGLKNAVTFLGFVENANNVISQCDFGVLPAIWREPFGLGNLQYMMHGKCHIATNNGGQKEYLTDGINSLLVDPDNAEILAQKIQLLIEDCDLRKRLGEQAKADFEAHLSYQHFYDQTTSVYKSLF